MPISNARDQQYAEILKRRQEYEAELNEKAGPPDMGTGGAAKGKGLRWQKALNKDRRKRRAAQKPPSKELNSERCWSCLAEPGKPCVSKRTGFALPSTHATYAKRRQEEARLNNPDFKPIALDETYDR